MKEKRRPRVTSAFSPRSSAILLFLMTIGTALRLYQLNTGLWYDEIVTLLASVRPPLLEILSQFQGNNDHPLYSVIAHFSIVSLGEAPWTLRLPSALFGIAGIPALYLVGSLVTSRFEAMLAATILTVSYHDIWFSQNARGYTLLLLCVLVATYLLLRWLAEGRTTYVVAYAVVAALGAYTHLTMVFVCVSHGVVCAVEVFRSRKSSPRLDWGQAAIAFGGAGLLTVLLYAPKLADVQKFFTTENVTGAEVATPMWAMLQMVQGLQLGFGTLWSIAIGALICGAGVWSYFRRHAGAFWLFVLPVPVTVGLALAAGRPIFPRFVFFAIGFALLIAVRGAAAVGTWIAERVPKLMSPRQAGRMAALAVTMGAVALSIRSLPYGYRYPKQDFNEAAAFVEHQKQGGDLVVVVGVTSAVPLRDYLGKPWPRVDRQQELRDLVPQGGSLWLVYSFPIYVAVDQPELWATIQRDCREVARFEGTVAGGAISVARCVIPGL
jgi:mannosyltransferase